MTKSTYIVHVVFVCLLGGKHRQADLLCEHDQREGGLQVRRLPHSHAEVAASYCTIT